MDYKELKARLKNIESELSPSERSKRYLAGEKVDHIPHNLMLGGEALCEIYGYKTSEMNADFNIYAEIIKRKREDFGIDGVDIGLGLRTLGAAMGSTLVYPEHGFGPYRRAYFTGLWWLEQNGQGWSV